MPRPIQLLSLLSPLRYYHEIGLGISLTGKRGPLMRTRALAPIMVLAAVTLIAATGACLVHADDSAPDLCPSLLAMTVGLLLPFSLGLSGQFILARPDGYDLSPFDLPAPPPKA